MQYLKYSDICLVPRHSSLKSREDADVSVNFLGNKFKLPIVPSNMKDVIDVKNADYLAKNCYFYIMHRWFHNHDYNYESILLFIKYMNKESMLTSISVGVGKVWENFILDVKKTGCYVDYITVDVAHADHDNVKGIIEVIRKEMPKTKLIVGNVATPEGCEYLAKLGVDALKVGIGSGRICGTANKTGFHIPMFSCCLHCAPVCEKYNIPFIADGGIVEFGDIAKAITAGATMVMSGGIFAECIDSPAEIVNGYKQYRGSTSFEIKGVNDHVEGKKIEVKYSVKYSERLEEIRQALCSSVSYAGGNNLSAFNLVNYITV